MIAHEPFCPKSGVRVSRCLGCNPIADLCAPIQPGVTTDQQIVANMTELEAQPGCRCPETRRNERACGRTLDHGATACGAPSESVKRCRRRRTVLIARSEEAEL